MNNNELKSIRWVFPLLIVLLIMGIIMSCQPTPTAEPIPTATQIPETITMFEPGDVQVFFKDDDATERFNDLWAVYNEGIISFHVAANSSKLSAREGTMMIIPNPIQDLITLGGVREAVKGSCIIQDGTGRNWYTFGVAEWMTGPDGRGAIAIRSDRDGPMVRFYGLAESSLDHPWNLHYGIVIDCSIPILP